MFTIDQIKEAHSRVKSGSDFPNYIQELIAMGVKGYDTFVTDGHSEYFGDENHRAIATETYTTITVAPFANKERFIEFLVLHQNGQTDFITFCNHAGQCGIAKWSVDINEMTCTYYDQSNAEILIEKM
jgi:uncharacterized protein YbcV (DUF1398 family)